MPSNPKKIKREYRPERKAFARANDLYWFYNSYKWRKKSKSYRSKHPVCECKDCEENNTVKPAEVVDHIQGLQFLLDKNIDPFSDDELQSMSHECHNKKSGKDSMRSRGKGV